MTTNDYQIKQLGIYSLCLSLVLRSLVIAEGVNSSEDRLGFHLIQTYTINSFKKKKLQPKTNAGLLKRLYRLEHSEMLCMSD